MELHQTASLIKQKRVSPKSTMTFQREVTVFTKARKCGTTIKLSGAKCIFRGAEEIRLGTLHRDEIMAGMVNAKGFEIFKSTMRSYWMN